MSNKFNCIFSLVSISNLPKQAVWKVHRSVLCLMMLEFSYILLVQIQTIISFNFCQGFQFLMKLVHDVKVTLLYLQLDPELEFDREVYPLGLLPNAGVVVGVSQRMSFSACTEFPCFEPTPQAQTILHCLLRHLLQVTDSKPVSHHK